MGKVMNTLGCPPSQQQWQIQWQMKAYTDPPTKKYNIPGGNWNRGQGDKPMNTIQNTHMQGGWNLVHGPVGVAEWLQDLN